MQIYNMTLSGFCGFLIMAVFVSYILRGVLLVRAIGWCAVWQFMTPVNPSPWIDILAMIGIFVGLEILYRYFNGTLRAAE